jgi:cellulose synthase/poly-beta-1,6-N-acetylglucosamine synthase-like glycosyltransferase
MGTPVLASVVMAVYNGERYLQESLESILAQTSRDFEFIVVDDGSEDGSAVLLNHYAQSDTRLRVHRLEHSGVVGALNAGCRLAQGKYIVRMDADDIAFPDRLQRQIDFLERNPEVALLGGAYVLMNAYGVVGTTLRKPANLLQIKAMMRRGHNPFLHSTVMMRKDAFHNVGGYRSAFLHAEDYDLWLRFVERYRVANLCEPLIYYRVHSEQVSHHNLAQGVMSVLASQASAKIREATGYHLRWQVGGITPEVLHDLGVYDRIIQQALTEAYFWQANMMLLSGNGDGGLPLLAEALSHSRARFMRRKVGQWLCRVQAKVYRKQPGLARRIVLELLLLLNAFCTQLGLAKALILFDISRLLHCVWQYRLKAPGLKDSRELSF